MLTVRLQLAFVFCFLLTVNAMPDLGFKFLSDLLTPRAQSQDDDVDRNDPICVYPPPPIENIREKYRYRPLREFNVYCYPSQGGVVVLEGDAVLLKHLGIERWQDCPVADDQDEEDRFCEDVRRLGAQWWPNVDKYYESLTRGNHKSRWAVETGWPTDGNGVWVWRVDLQVLHNWDLCRQLVLCVNMDERSELIKKYGGEFFESWKDCQWLRMDTVKDDAPGGPSLRKEEI